MNRNRLGANSAVPGIGIDPALSLLDKAGYLHLQISVSCSAELGTITGSVLTSVATAVDQEFLTTKSGTWRSHMRFNNPNRVHRSGIGWAPRRSQTIPGAITFLPDEPTLHERWLMAALPKEAETVKPQTGRTATVDGNGMDEVVQLAPNSRRPRPDVPYREVLRAIAFLAGVPATL